MPRIPTFTECTLSPSSENNCKDCVKINVLDQLPKSTEFVIMPELCICSSNESHFDLSIHLSISIDESSVSRGTTFVNEIELITQERLLTLYGLLQPKQPIGTAEWTVNVQSFSGSTANLAVYTAFLKPGDRLMGLNCKHGGHSTHGFYSGGLPMSAASIFYEHKSFGLDLETEQIDYTALEKEAKIFNPKMIIAGSSTHPRLIDYEKLRSICDSVGAILVADMAHIAGLVAAKVVPSPFLHADIVTTTTQKTLRGPRAGLIFARNRPRKGGSASGKFSGIPFDEFPRRIDRAIFPGLQSGPHLNTIAGIAAVAKESNTPEFANYASQVIMNAKFLGRMLSNKGIRLVSGGTDIHFIVIDLSTSPGLNPDLGEGDAILVQVVADSCGLVMSAISVPAESNVSTQSGMRIGTQSMTTRGFCEDEMQIVGDFIWRVFQISKSVKTITNALDEVPLVISNDIGLSTKIKELRKEVAEFASKYPMPGFDDT